jgi:hypothetical protein
MEAARQPEPAGSAVVVSQGGLESHSPATGELLGSVPTVSPGDVQSIVDDVAHVQPFWAQLPFADRSRYMRRAAQAILDDIDDIRDLIAREQRDPRSWPTSGSPRPSRSSRPSAPRSPTSRWASSALSRPGIIPGRSRSARWRWR